MVIDIGITIGNRYETIPSDTRSLLAHYYPNDQYISNAQIPAISMTPRRIERGQSRGYSQRLYLPLDQTLHQRTPLFRPLYGPTISRKSFDPKHSSVSPGPATYPMYEFDEDILPRPQVGITQKHRLKTQTLQTKPPFYYPPIINRHRLPSFTIGRRLLTSKKPNQYTAPYYSSIDHKAFCSNVIKPGVTLKGRWSPLVYIPKT